MPLLEHRGECRRYGEELQPLLREHVARSAVKPGFGAGFLLLATGLRQIPEHAIGHQADFVVVVEDHAAMAGDTEILEQQVAWEHVAGR